MKTAVHTTDGMSKLEDMKAYDSCDRRNKVVHKIPGKNMPQKVRIQTGIKLK
jgi:hypothetical protein